MRTFSAACCGTKYPRCCEDKLCSPRSSRPHAAAYACLRIWSQAGPPAAAFVRWWPVAACSADVRRRRHSCASLGALRLQLCSSTARTSAASSPPSPRVTTAGASVDAMTPNAYLGTWPFPPSTSPPPAISISAEIAATAAFAGARPTLLHAASWRIAVRASGGGGRDHGRGMIGER